MSLTVMLVMMVVLLVQKTVLKAPILMAGAVMIVTIV